MANHPPAVRFLTEAVKGTPGGVPILDADGDVIDGNGEKVVIPPQVPSTLQDMTGTLALNQVAPGSTKMVVFGQPTAGAWEVSPAGGRLDIHIHFVGGTEATPPPVVAGRDLWTAGDARMYVPEAAGWRCLNDNHIVGVAPPPPPALKPMLIGASQFSYDQLNTDTINTGSKAGAVNTGLSMRRSYDGSWRNFSLCTAKDDPANGRASWISFSNPNTAAGINSGATDAAITSFFNSIPAGHTTFVTWIHEPDGGKVPASDYAAYRTATAHIHDLLVASNADKRYVKFAPIITAQGYRSNLHTNFLPADPSKYDFVGVDVYEYVRGPGDTPDAVLGGMGTERTPSYLLGPAVTLSLQLGKPLAIGEYGAHPFPNDATSRPRRLKQFVDFLDAHSAGCLAFCYFHSGLGAHGAWWLDRFHNYDPDQYSPNRDLGAPDPDSMTAWRNVVAAHVKSTG